MSDFFCSVPILSTLVAACTGLPPLATGYVEGEFRLIAPVTTARVETLSVQRGDRLEAGQVLAVMETRDAEIALAEAVAGLEMAESELANLKEGMRDEEIRVIEAALTSAQAEAQEATREAERQSDLLRRGIAPQSSADEALTRLEKARALIAEVEANLAVARLPARPHQIAAADAQVARATAARDAAEWELHRRQLEAPADGAVYEILRTSGEIAGPQSPVLSMLPDGAVILRLYVPQANISAIAPGSTLSVNCDGCPASQTATVTYVADAPEFTPPVIYSLENRQKLVFLIEARPDENADRLKPGQIVDVRLEDGK